VFDTPEYGYRVFVTNMSGGVAMLTRFYNQRAGAENLIKEAKNDGVERVEPHRLTAPSPAENTQAM